MAAEPPLTLGAYDEGDGLLSLYLTPCPASSLATSIRRLGHRTCRQIGILDRVVPTTSLHQVRMREMPAPLELLPPGTREANLLSDPHGTIDTWGITWTDLHHGIIFSRQPEILLVFLTDWLGQQLSRTDLPPIQPSALAPLLEVLPMGLWREVTLKQGTRLCTLELAVYGADRGGRVRIDHIAPRHCEPLRWIGSREAGWRTNWRW